MTDPLNDAVRRSVATYLHAGLLAGGESISSNADQVADRAVVHADALLRRLGTAAPAPDPELLAAAERYVTGGRADQLNELRVAVARCRGIVR